MLWQLRATVRKEWQQGDPWWFIGCGDSPIQTVKVTFLAQSNFYLFQSPAPSLQTAAADRLEGTARYAERIERNTSSSSCKGIWDSALVQGIFLAYIQEKLFLLQTCISFLAI